MSDYTVFANAPITEALLDIRVELPKSITTDKLAQYHETIKDRFLEKKQRMVVSAGFRLSPEGQTELLPSSGETDGYLFRSYTENKIVQARMDGFTFNKLKPYEDWAKFSSEAHSLWDIYLKQFNPQKIVRIALRYINRIEVPLTVKDLKEYILTAPEVAPKLSLTRAHFFMQVVMRNQEIDASAVITETVERPIENQKLPLILDIDVFKERIYVDDKEAIWDDFEKLRIFKNDIFLNSITDKTKELFK